MRLHTPNRLQSLRRSQKMSYSFYAYFDEGPYFSSIRNKSIVSHTLNVSVQPYHL